MADLFDSAWMKFGWAIRHCTTLENEVNTWRLNANEQTPFTTTRRYDAKRHGVIYTIDTFTPLPPEWGLYLGDAVHNLRSCLDHIAWACVRRGRTPNLTPWQEKGVYFPIADTPEEWGNALKGPKDRKGNRVGRPMLPGVRLADLAKIRVVQPYIHGKRDGRKHAFTALQRLSNDDKHREIQPLLSVPSGMTFDGLTETDFKFRCIPRQARRIPLDVGVEVGWFYGRKLGPNPDVQVNGEMTVEPALQGGRFLLQDWMQKTAVTIRALLWSFQEPPRNLLERLAVIQEPGTFPLLEDDEAVSPLKG
ncbi:MAG TPA: hypothetical protein VHD91_05675 [Gaiellaceae bacterium]|nr:hypothetical protein [Gaiellaceae bacterium]